MKNTTANFPALLWLALLMALGVLLPAPRAHAQDNETTAIVNLAYPSDLEDEHERPFKQDVKVELYRIMTDEAKQHIIQGLEKRKRQAESDSDKEQLDAEIASVKKQKNETGVHHQHERRR